MKSMKTVIGWNILLIYFLATAAYGHAPQKVNLEFEKQTGVLKVSFTHKVRNEKQHFIYRAEIKVNKKLVIEQSMKQQDDTDNGSLIYKLPGVKSGDTITVSLSCNKWGTKTTKLKVTENE